MAREHLCFSSETDHSDTDQEDRIRGKRRKSMSEEDREWTEEKKEYKEEGRESMSENNEGA